jgi:hypothetical protein
MLTATDADGDALTYSIVGADSGGGTLSGLSANRVTYTPKAGFSGTDHFHFEAWDAQTNSAQAQYTILVQALPRIEKLGIDQAGRLTASWCDATNGVFIDFAPSLMPTASWQVVAGPLAGVTNWTSPALSLPSGFYRIRGQE